MKKLLHLIFSALLAVVVVMIVIVITLNNQFFDMLFQFVVFPLSTFHIGGQGHPPAETLFLILLPVGVLTVLAVALKKNITELKNNGRNYGWQRSFLRIILVLFIFGSILLFTNFPLFSIAAIPTLLYTFFWIAYFTALYYLFFFTIYTAQHIIYNKINIGTINIFPLRRFFNENIFKTTFFIGGALWFVPLLPIIWGLVSIPDAVVMWP